MLKRVITIVTSTVCLTCLVLLAWQPVQLKTKLFNSIAESIPPSVPYEVKIARVSGSFFNGLLFEDVRLVKRKSAEELLRIPSVSLAWSWSDLFFHKQFHVNQMIVALGGGKAILQGTLTLSPVPSGQYIVDDENFPLQKLTAFIGQIPPAVSLHHTGRWTIRKDSGTVVVNFEGRLENGPATFHLSWNPDPHVLLNGGGRWTSPFADIRMQFRKGVGAYEGAIDLEGIKSVVKGQLDLPHQSIQGRGVLNDVTWQHAHLSHMNFNFSADAHQQALEVDAHDFQKQKDKTQPSDLRTTHLVLKGLWPRWNAVASLTFRDASTGDMTGHLFHEGTSWTFAWKKASFSLPTAGTWSSLGPGMVSWSKSRLTLQNVDLANGSQNVHLKSAVKEANRFRFDLLANQLNLAPWAKLFLPDVSLEGTLNTSLQVAGTPSELHVDGYLKGQFPSVTVDAVGLSVRDIDMELRSANQKVDIVRFVGKTKKGELQVTGSSVLPQLAYAIHVRHVSLEPFPQAKAIADADINLSGTWASPFLSGLVTLEEGSYIAKKDKKKEVAAKSTPCCQTSRMDIKVAWARNVWYHEGVSSIETKGNLRVQKMTAAAPFTVTGEITSLRGSYSYFGRDFNIESGQMQFTGTPGFDPALAIEASYANGATTVYLDMTGTIEKPVLKMRSNPPLPEQDIVSVIVFGQPLSSLRSASGGTTSNQEMMQAAGGVLGSYIARGLNQTGVSALNFDVLNIQPADQGGSQLIVGRYLTRRLFVNYGQTVRGSAEKTITADYFLTDKWTLQGVSDSTEGNYMDFLFRYPLNKRQSAVNTSPVPHSPFRDSLDTPVLQQQFRTPLQ